MSDYSKLDVRQLPKTSQLTAEDRYWRSFKVRCLPCMLPSHPLSLSLSDLPTRSLASPLLSSPLCFCSRVWQSPVVHRHFVKVTDVQFNPIAPHDVAACASTRVSL